MSMESTQSHPKVDYRPFDADNHYYEAVDSFTRHLDPAISSRCVQWVEMEGRRHHLVGGRLCKAVSNPTFDPIARPGIMYDYLRGTGEGQQVMELLKQHEPIPAAYRGSEARACGP